MLAYELYSPFTICHGTHVAFHAHPSDAAQGLTFPLRSPGSCRPCCNQSSCAPSPEKSRVQPPGAPLGVRGLSIRVASVFCSLGSLSPCQQLLCHTLGLLHCPKHLLFKMPTALEALSSQERLIPDCSIQTPNPRARQPIVVCHGCHSKRCLCSPCAHPSHQCQGPCALAWHTVDAASQALASELEGVASTIFPSPTEQRDRPQLALPAGSCPDYKVVN